MPMNVAFGKLKQKAHTVRHHPRPYSEAHASLGYSETYSETFFFKKKKI